MVPDYDVGIIGGGPAGSSLAAYLAKNGVRCVVYERETFPREHVGESLVPSSTRVFKDLDFLSVMEELKFPHKYGAAWTSVEGGNKYDHDWDGLEPDCHVDIAFAEREQPGIDQNYTYHVDRGKFDKALLDHAEKLGATVRQGVSVRDADFSDPSMPRLTIQADGKDETVSVRIVVDASGRRTMLGNRLKLKVMDPVFNQFAIHTWFEGFERPAGRQGDMIFIHFLPISNSWVWQIPITDTITSIGVVTQKKNFSKGKADREQFFWDCVASRPELYQGLKESEQMRPLKDEGDYSYGMREICGDGWVMIGDASRFVDPIFSTGVSIALNSARLVYPDILAALESGDTTKQAFRSYEETIQRGTKNWYDFIAVYYRLNVLFTAFLRDERYRLDVLKLLQGDVYDDESPPVLAKMREIVSYVEETPDHIWHDLLGDLTVDAYRDAHAS